MKHSYNRFLLRSFKIILGIFSFFLFSPLVFAAWTGQPYSVGETLNPECAPTDENCTVNATSLVLNSLRFANLNSNSAGSTTASGILGINENGEVVVSSLTSPLSSQAIAYWDGLNDPTVSGNAYPRATMSGRATFIEGSGVRLTPAEQGPSGSLNWSFAQLPFERTQFNYKAGGGDGADSTWFYSYADGVPVDEMGEGMNQGYIFYFSEFHDCVGLSYGPYADGQQCGSGGVNGAPLVSAHLDGIDDSNWHNVDISTIQNRLIMRWDGKVVIDYTDVYGRDLTGLKFGFGSRTGSSVNNHFIKGLVVSKLGTNISEFNIATTTAIQNNLYWDNFNHKLSIGTTTISAALSIVNGSENDPVSMHFLTGYEDNTPSKDLAISGNYMYAADGNLLEAFDISNPTNENYLGNYNLGYQVLAVKAVGDLVYAAAGQGVFVFDASNHNQAPVLLGGYETNTTVRDIQIQDGIVYAIDSSNTLYSIDVSAVNANNPVNPADIQHSFETINIQSPSKLAVSGNYAYISGATQFQIINISDPANPTSVATYTYTGDGFYGGIAVSGNYLYLTRDASDGKSFVVFNVTDKSNPVEVGHTDIGNYRYATRIILADGYAYVADGEPDSIYAIDISDPAHPFVTGHASSEGGNTYGLAVTDSNIFVANGNAGITVFSKTISNLKNTYAAIFKGGNVGIGTTTPNRLLTVGGNIQTSGAIYFADGSHISSAAEAGISQWSNNGEDIYFNTGRIGIGTSTPTSAITVVGTNTRTAFDENNNLAVGEWSYDGDWYSDEAGFHHSYSVFPSSLLLNINTVSSETYKVSFVVSSRTTGYVEVSLGNDSSNIRFDKNSNLQNPSTLMLQSYGGTNIQFSPSPDFDGIISDINIYHATSSDATISLLNTDGSSGLEIRSGSGPYGSLDNYFFGENAGAFSAGYVTLGLGLNSAEYNTGGFVNAIGMNAAQNNSGSGVNAIGINALQNNSGNSVDAIGSYALADKQGGDAVVGIGSDNSENGFLQGAQKNIEKSILIGPSSMTHVDSNSADIITNVIALGGRATESNQTVLGNSSTTSALIFGNVGLGSTSPSTKLVVEGDHQVSMTKTGEFKTALSYLKYMFAAGDSTSTVYAADTNFGLFGFDISNHSNPRVSTFQGIPNVSAVYVQNRLAYVASSAILRVYDTSTFPSWDALGEYDTEGGGISSIQVKNGVAYLGVGVTLQLYDVSQISPTNQANPILLGSITFGSTVTSVKIKGTVAYVSTRAGLFSVDISDIGPNSPGSPSIIGSYPGPNFEDVEISGTHAYLVDIGTNVYSLDVSNPAKIQKDDMVSLAFQNVNLSQNIKISGDYAFISDGMPDSIFAVYIGDPKRLSLAGHISTESTAIGLSVVGDNLYVSEGTNGMEVFNISKPRSTIASFVNGNVGIGTTNPVAPLQVAGLGGTGGLKFLSSYKSPTLQAGAPSDKVGNYLYTQSAPDAFDIIDVSDPTHSVWKGTFHSMGGMQSGPKVFGNTAYITNNSGTVIEVDVSNPASPQPINSYEPPTGNLHNLIPANNYYLYGIDGDGNIETVLTIYGQHMSTTPSVQSSTFNQLVMSGTRIYAKNNLGNIEIFNINDPSHPAPLGIYTPQVGEAGNFIVSGNRMYINVDGYSSKLEIVDITDPTEPTFISEYNSPTNWLNGLAVKGNYVFEENNAGRIEVIDVSNAQKPKYVTDFTPLGGNQDYFNNFLVSGNYLYALDGSNKIETIDISNPKAPLAAIFTGGRVGVGTDNPNAAFSVVGDGGDGLTKRGVYTSKYGSIHSNPYVVGNYAYVLDGGSNLEIIDVSDSNNPVMKSKYGSETGHLQDVIASGNYVYATNNDGKIEIINVASSTNPTYVNSITASDQGTFQFFNVKDGYVYAPDGSGNIEIFDARDPQNISQVYTFDDGSYIRTTPMIISGNYLYAVNNGTHLSVIDISNPLSPFTVNNVSVHSGYIASVSVLDNILYIADSDSNLELFSITNNFAYESSYTASNWSAPSGISINPYSSGANNYVFVSAGCDIRTLNVDNPKSPFEVDSHLASNNEYCYSDPFVVNGHAYVSTVVGAFVILDVSGVAHPSLAATFANGRVGIGTDNPMSLLDVGGNITLSGQNRYINFTTQYGLNPANSYGIRDNGGVMQFKNLNGSWTDFGSGGSSLWVASSTDTYDATGSVSIGTTTVLEKLTVDGRVSANSFAVGLSYSDYVNNSPWYGIGNSNVTLPGADYASSTVQVAGYYGIEFVTQQGDMVLNEQGNVGIGTNSPNPTAILDLNSTTKTFLPPRMTQTQRDAISSPGVGSVVFNTDTNTLQYYSASSSGYSEFTTSGGYGHATVAMGQTVTPQNTGNLNSIVGTFAVRPTGAGDAGKGDIVAKIYDAPNGNLLAISDNVVTQVTNVDFVAMEGTWTFAHSYLTLHSGTQYYIEFTDTDTSPNEFYFMESFGDSYPNGAFYYGTHGSVGTYEGADLALTFNYGNSSGGWANIGGGWKADSSGGVVLDSGNVVIGTGTSTSALQVNGDIRIASGSGGRLYFGDGSSMLTSTATGTGIESSNDLNFVSGGQISFGTGDGNSTTTRLVIKNDGSIGIGTNNPNSPLDIATGPGQNTGIILENFNDNFDDGSALTFKDSQVNAEVAKIRSVAYFFGVSGLAFDVNAGNGLIEALRITPDGDVGIGMNLVGIGGEHPNSKLHIEGNTNNLLTLQSTTGGVGNTVNLDFQTYESFNGNPSPTSRVSAVDDGSFSSSLAFLTKNPGNNGNSLIERMRISSNGLVGIGTSTPDQALTVQGNIDATGDVCNQAYCLSDFGSPSDQRFKINITALETDATSSSILSNIMKLNPVTYNWNSTYLGLNPNALDASSTKLGFIAQDVQQVFPEVVVQMHNGFLGIDYGKITSILTAGMQEMVRITGVFKDNLMAWLGDTTNGIKKFFVDEVHTKKICVAKTDGTEVCVTGDQLQKIVDPTVPVNTVSSTSNINVQNDIATTTVDTSASSTSEEVNTSTSTESNSHDNTGTSSVEYSGGSNQTTTANAGGDSTSTDTSSGGSTTTGSDSGSNSTAGTSSN